MRNLTRFAGIACALALTGATASAQFSLQTLYAANNGGSSGGIVYFDITVASPVLITAFDMNYDPGYAPTGQAVGLQVYTTPGTYVGVEGNQAAWTQVAADNGTATAAGVINTPTNIPLATPLLMPAGSFGMALVAVSAGHDYTTGSAITTYSDNFLTLNVGAAYNSPFGSASPFSPRLWNGAIYYTPANGLYSSFSATPTSGSSPLLVQFTDTTFTSDPGGVTSWAWDLDGDGVVDSTIQNPSFTYNVCGTYDVTLTTTDATNPPSTFTQTSFIDVDPGLRVAADFTPAPTSGPTPLTVAFTDTSTGTPTTWQWDLDGDGVVDSTLQNPSFTYNTCGFYTVTLTASNACYSDTETKVDVISADSQLVVTADFTASVTLGGAPLLVNFTDTSTGSPTTWAWDLDGDTVVDSTLQNPSFTYNVAGRYDVTLTAGNVCFSDVVTKTGFVIVVGNTSNTLSADMIEYQFNEVRGNKVFNSASTTLTPEFGTVAGSSWQGDAGRVGFMGNEAGFGCMFADNTSPYESKVDTGWTIDINGSHTIMFWSRVNGTPGTSYAFGGSSGSARCYNSGRFSVRTWGNLPGYIDSATDPDTTVGWVHWAVVVDDAAGTGQWYLNGVPDGTALSYTPGTFSMSGFGNLLVGGYGTTSSMYGRYHDMDDFRLYSRALNPTQIMAAMAHENATTSRYDEGCAGPSTVPVIGANSAPTPGNAGFGILLDNAEPSRLAALYLGFEANAWMGVVPLPYNLDFIFGAGSGCNLHTGLDIGINWPTGPGTTGYSAPIPYGSAGAHMYAQWIILGTQGAVTSGLDINIQVP